MGTRSRVLIIVDDSVLLVRGWLGTGQWQVPGGGVHRGEHPVAGALREVAEETSITLQAKDLKPMYETTGNYRGLKFRYTCYIAHLTKRPPLQKQALEITEITWFPLKKVTAQNTTADTYQAVQTWSKTQNLL